MLRIKRLEIKKMVLSDDSEYDIVSDAILKFSLYEDKEISKDDLAVILKFSLTKTLQEKVITYIAYSPRTEYQVRKYLERKSLKKDCDIDKIVLDLKEFKYIDDREFAESFVKSRLKGKYRSKFVLKSELMSKGIDKDLANEVVEENVNSDYEVLKKLYEKKYGSELLNFSEKKKINFLQRKGFSWSDISKLVGEINDT